jgi:hypothetical protein
MQSQELRWQPAPTMADAFEAAGKLTLECLAGEVERAAPHRGAGTKTNAS